MFVMEYEPAVSIASLFADTVSTSTLAFSANLSRKTHRMRAARFLTPAASLRTRNPVTDASIHDPSANAGNPRSRIFQRPGRDTAPMNSTSSANDSISPGSWWVTCQMRQRSQGVKRTLLPNRMVMIFSSRCQRKPAPWRGCDQPAVRPMPA